MDAQNARCLPPRQARAIAAIALAWMGSVTSVHAACNLIPRAAQTFRGALGAINRPFAAPGEDHVVTIVFKPTGGQARVVVLTAGSCGGGSIKSAQLACEGTAGVGAGNVSCVHATPNDLAVVDRNGSRRLAFRFPDTDAFLAPDADDRTLAGPATIAVTAAGTPLPCGLATSTCATQPGAIACVDEIYSADGICQQTVGETFSHFTALPVRPGRSAPSPAASSRASA